MARRKNKAKPTSSDRITPADASVASGVDIEFLARFLADKEEGKERPLEEYLRQFPGAERAVVREFFGLDAESPATSMMLTSHSGSETRTFEVPVRQLEERYEVRSLLGVGGMGEVYLARDRTLDRDVAV